MKKVAYMVVLLAFILVFLCSCGGSIEENIPNDEYDNNTPLNVNVDILKVGKADCIIINTGSNVLMIDTGEKENLSEINRYMYMNDCEKIDTLILTHYDKDHIGCAAEVIEKYQVSKVIESGIVSINEWYIEYHNAIERMEIDAIQLSQDYYMELDGCRITVNAPKKSKYNEKQDNNSSLVVSMVCNQKKLLFCADAMELRINELIADNLGSYDFVKLPYHGHYLENYRSLLNMVSPQYGAITCSNKNPPDEKTLSLLSEYGVCIYQTRYGDIHIFTDGENISITQ